MVLTDVLVAWECGTQGPNSLSLVWPCVQVAALRERLEAFGVDVDALLAPIIAAGEAPDGEDLT